MQTVVVSLSLRMCQAGSKLEDRDCVPSTRVQGFNYDDKKTGNDDSTAFHLGRRDAVTLRRLRIGHTRFSHSYLLNRVDQPRCTYCDCALTVVHMLLECPHYQRWVKYSIVQVQVQVLT